MTDASWFYLSRNHDERQWLSCTMQHNNYTKTRHVVELKNKH
jgi:hypothetical protein